MKKTTLILFCFFCFINIHFYNSQNQSSNWDYIDNYFVDNYFTVHKFNEDIRLKLLDNYTVEDSVFVSKLVEDLNKIISSVNIDMVNDNQNFSFTINGEEKRVKPFDQGISKGGGYSCDPLNGSLGEARVKLNFDDSISQDLKNKTIKYSILRALIPTPKLYTDALSNPKSRSDYPDESINSGGIYSHSNYKDTSFNEFDKRLLSTIYSNDFYFNLYRKKPILFYKYAKRNLLKNGQIVTPQSNLPTNLGSILLITYIILILKFYNFRKRNKNWLKLCLNGIVLSMPLFILIIDEINYISKYKEFIAPIMLSTLILVYISVLGILSGSTYFFITKIKSFKELTYLFQFSALFISGLISVFILEETFEISRNYRNLLLLYILILSLIEISINIVNDKSTQAIKDKELQLSKMEALKTKAELQAIQSRINPHFLYNSLNSIASLALSNPNKTREMALSLSEFCRFSINKNNRESVLIEDEIKMVSSYLEIEKIRFGDKLNFSLKIDKDVKKKYIPKFIIQPLIENAIKHGASKTSKACSIQLVIEMEKNGLLVTVIDDGPEFPESLIYGYGLQSIYDILEIFYSGKAKLNWTNKPVKKITIWFPNSNN